MQVNFVGGRKTIPFYRDSLIQVNKYLYKREPFFCYLKFLYVCAKFLKKGIDNFDEYVNVIRSSEDLKFHDWEKKKCRFVVEHNSLCRSYEYYFEPKELDKFILSKKTKKIKRNKIKKCSYNYEFKEYIYKYKDAKEFELSMNGEQLEQYLENISNFNFN